MVYLASFIYVISIIVSCPCLICLCLLFFSACLFDLWEFFVDLSLLPICSCIPVCVFVLGCHFLALGEGWMVLPGFVKPRSIVPVQVGFLSFIIRTFLFDYFAIRSPVIIRLSLLFVLFRVSVLYSKISSSLCYGWNYTFSTVHRSLNCVFIIFCNISKGSSLPLGICTNVCIEIFCAPLAC